MMIVTLGNIGNIIIIRMRGFKHPQSSNFPILFVVVLRANQQQAIIRGES
jgi:hypothetical protein